MKNPVSRSSTNRLLRNVALLTLFFPLLANARPTPLQINQKIHNLETILSHARRETGNDAELAKVYTTLEEAESALEKGDHDAAEALYSKAWNAYQATVKAARGSDHKAADERVLASRIASIKALLKQLEEINKGNDDKKVSEPIENVKSLLAQAEAAQDTAKARTYANQAYYMMKILLKDARNGKTLTVDHTFATPALKYADDLAYNDMHFGLLDTALEKMQAKADAEYNKLVESAKQLRAQAEEAAEHQDFENASRDLALSTNEVKKALKHIGVAVPGM